MRSETIRLLLDINSQFYQKFGDAFAATRRRIQPGIQQLLPRIPKYGHWLDLGCGSANLALVWAQQERQGSYTGVDFSEPLLAEARRTAEEQGIPSGLEIKFQQADLLDPDWTQVLDRESYDGVMSFAVLHHIPGYANRLRIAGQVRTLLPAGGWFIHSNWQFHHSPRLMERVQPWSVVPVDASDLEAGDTLLDWRYALPGQEETVGYRYVHRFQPGELEEMACEAGFKIEEVFESDGAGGRLGLYQVWQAV